MAKKSAKDLDAELAALEAELAALEAKKKAPKAEPKKAAASPPPAAAPSPPPAAPSVPGLWRRDGDAWVRTVPGATPTIRRILDEHGNVVREETIARAEIERQGDVKAERGAAKILGRFRR